MLYPGTVVVTFQGLVGIPAVLLRHLTHASLANDGVCSSVRFRLQRSVLSSPVLSSILQFQSSALISEMHTI